MVETRRRRTMTWLAFGLVGMLMGVIWAVGYATSNAVVDTAGATAAPAVFGTPPADSPTSEYDGLITSNTPLTIGFVGTWGKIDANTPMFDVDLTAQTSGTYFVDVLLTNNPGGWSVLQLEFLRLDLACSAATAVDWASPAASSVMVIENEDAYATFSGLAAASEHCIGVQATLKANDPAGTFIRRPSPTSSPTAPSFAATLNRSS